jgi:ATP-dependent exoDNAse (exonuclease V) alpha subunit
VRAADSQDARPQPTRGPENGALEPCGSHHRRTGRGQDDPGELDPDNPLCEGREVLTVCSNGTGGEAALLDEISLAYAITIHKSQGSEFPAVVIPLATQHYMLLQRDLIYTGITRGKRLLVLIGQKKALGIAVRNDRPQKRYSGLLASLRGGG